MDELQLKLRDTEFKIDGPQQRQLAMKVLMFNDVLEGAISDLLTHKITDYL